jgi:hypothetical protein
MWWHLYEVELAQELLEEHVEHHLHLLARRILSMVVWGLNEEESCDGSQRAYRGGDGFDERDVNPTLCIR